MVSSTLEDPGWDGTTVFRGGDRLAEEMRALASRDGLDIVLTGSISLAHALFREDLVDEIRLFVNPLVLGEGRRLFPQGWEAPALELAEERRFSAGVVLLRYVLPRRS